jgi:hypothetical protein
MRPPDFARIDFRAALDEAIATEVTQIKLQSSCRQTRSRARPISMSFIFLSRRLMSHAVEWLLNRQCLGQRAYHVCGQIKAG